MAAFSEFSDWGYEATTTKTIAARAGVADGGFYQHFENKAEILRLLAQSHYEELIGDIRKYDIADIPRITSIDELKDRLMNTINLVYDFRANSSQFHQVLDQRRHIDASLNEIILRGERALLKRVREFVSIFDATNAQETAFSVFAMIEGAVLRHTTYPNNVSRKKALDAVGRCLAVFMFSLTDKRASRRAN